MPELKMVGRQIDEWTEDLSGRSMKVKFPDDGGISKMEKL